MAEGQAQPQQPQRGGSRWGTIFRGISAAATLAFVGYFGYSIYQGSKPPVLPGYSARMPVAKDAKMVAVIPIDRALSSWDSGSTVSSDTVINMINQAEDAGMDAYILEVNSGGGSVLPSKEIMERVQELSQGHYTVAVIRDIGASGAYWIASACDEVVADETSLVGSIGVRMDYLEFSGLLEKLGIGYVDIHSGERKTMGSPYKNLTEEETALLEEIVRETHEMFINSVANNRNMGVEEVTKLATGQIYTGKMGVKNGLIDYPGGREEASILVEENLGEGFEVYVFYAKPPQSLFGGLLSTFGHSIGEGLADGLKDDTEQIKMKYRAEWAEE